MKDETIIISDTSPHLDENEHRAVSRYKRSDVKAVIMTENFLKQTRKIKTHLLDFGCNGLCLGSKDALPYFRHIELQLGFPGHPAFQLHGEVVYCKKPGEGQPLFRYGVTFTQEHQAYKDFIVREGLAEKLNHQKPAPSN